MFTQPAPAPSLPGLVSPTGLASPSSSNAASPASPTSRTSRLRGLSYLRSYTQNHLLSREHGGGGSSTPPGPTSPTSATSAAAASRPGAPLTRSVSSPYTPTTATATATLTLARHLAEGHSSHRFSLVPTLSHPLGRSSSPEHHPAAAAQPTAQSSAQGASSTGNTTRTTDAGPLNADEPGARSTMTRTRSATDGDAMVISTDSAVNGNGAPNNSNLDILPSIRFSTFYDPRATRPSLTFTPVSRTLPTGNEVIRVGRYSERDTQPPVPVNVPSAAPVGFKSKVVSRRHCEFWYEGGKWYIKDVKSSSGTFLNHIRLSPPGTESKPFPVNDGDIVQLGIDFKGGEEMIFRCVKMRLELNRGWQNKLNTFNMTTHKRLRNMTKPNPENGSTAQSYSQDCSICLNSIAPCQCLFVAPCSHTWHYKCIRSLLSSPQYPIFICPNCRAAADLEAEVEDPDEWEQVGSEPEDDAEHPTGETTDEASAQPSEAASKKSGDQQRTRQNPRQTEFQPPVDDDAMDVTMQIDPPEHPQAESASTSSRADTPMQQEAVSHATSNPVPIPHPTATTAAGMGTENERGTRTPSPNAVHAALLNGQEGPITPRNDAGPWVFDGSALGRVRSDASGAVDPSRMESLDGVADSS